jgi:hypothetical protein
VLLNTFAMCSANDYRCQNAACHEGYRSCNPNISVEDGCETDIAHDPDNCGGCGEECEEIPNGYRACSNMRCVLGGCELGYEHCDDSLVNGCETDIWSDGNCGGCFAGPCPAGQTCQAGVCR